MSRIFMPIMANMKRYFRFHPLRWLLAFYHRDNSDLLKRGRNLIKASYSMIGSF